MSQLESLRQVMRDRRLASLGDAYVNFVYSLALTQLKGYPQGTKVSDKILAQALKLADLRDHLGTRVARKDLANASESILAAAYRGTLLSIEESVQLISQHPEDPAAGLADLLKTAARRLSAPESAGVRS
jgi:dsRNA-specific ribonuclease